MKKESPFKFIRVSEPTYSSGITHKKWAEDLVNKMQKSIDVGKLIVIIDFGTVLFSYIPKRWENAYYIPLSDKLELYYTLVTLGQEIPKHEISNYEIYIINEDYTREDFVKNNLTYETR
jgi:hypothetical protein